MPGRAAACVVVLMLSPVPCLAGQDAAAPAAEAQKLVETWFARLNALDGTPETIQAFVDLHQADALLSTGPASHQQGTVTFHGHDGIGAMAKSFAATVERPAYRIETVTAKEKTARLFNTTEGPWGGPSVAVEFVAVQTIRAEGKRYMHPGAAFFQVDGGKIRRVRLYMATGEMAEVEGEARRRRP